MPQTTQDIVIRTQNLSVNYGKKQVLFDVNLEIPFKTVVAFIGASGCGKSSLLRRGRGGVRLFLFFFSFFCVIFN